MSFGGIAVFPSTNVADQAQTSLSEQPAHWAQSGWIKYHSSWHFAARLDAEYPMEAVHAESVPCLLLNFSKFIEKELQLH